MGVVTCSNLVKRYLRKEVLNIKELTIKENAITGLVGRNGAGKTTLLNLIAGFTRKTAGDINVFGYEPFDSLQVSANSIFIDDRMMFPDNLPLGNILEEMKRFYPNWNEQLANRLFEYFEFQKSEYHTKLSKGKRSTFNMIIGLAANVPLTIFDEPTTGMDVAVRKDFYRALLKNYLEHPRTIIVSSHHLNELEDLLERVILIDRGEVKLHLDMDDLREYAVGLTGPKDKLNEWSKGKDLIYKEGIGTDSMYVAVRDDVSEDEAIQLGFKRTSVSPTDVAIYVTGRKKGGIDDVFDDGGHDE